MAKAIYYGDLAYYELKCPNCGRLWDRRAPKCTADRVWHRTRLGRLCSACYVDEVYPDESLIGADDH